MPCCCRQSKQVCRCAAPTCSRLFHGSPTHVHLEQLSSIYRLSLAAYARVVVWSASGGCVGV